MNSHNKAINNLFNGNIVGMNESVSEILAEKVLNNLSARRATISVDMLLDESLGGPGGPSRQMSPNDMYASGLRTKALEKKHSKKKDNTAAIAKQVKQAVKKYTTGKLTVKSKGGKTRFIMVMADNIDNKLRKMVLDVAYPSANVRGGDLKNISYGNISDKIISASVDHWVKALGLNVNESYLFESDMLGKTVIVAGKKGVVTKFLGDDFGEKYKVKLEDGTVITSLATEMESIEESYLNEVECPKCKGEGCEHCDGKGYHLDEANQRFGGDTNIPADKKTKGYIESGRAKILMNVQSSLNKTARFVVAKNPNTGSNQDKVMMFTISDPDRGRIKMFAFHGSHVSHQKAMDFAKKHKLVAKEDAKGNPLYAKESYLYEYGVHTQKKGGKGYPAKGKYAIKLPKSAEGRSERQKQIIRQAMANNKKKKKNESYLGEQQRKVKTRSLTNPMKSANGLVYEFPNNRLANQFAKDVSNSGIATTELVDTTKVQVQMLPGSKSVGKSGLAKYLKKGRGKKLSESVISKLQESYISKISVDINIDGKTIHVTPDVSESIISLHDELNEYNQHKMRDILKSSASAFVEMANFAEERN